MSILYKWHFRTNVSHQYLEVYRIGLESKSARKYWYSEINVRIKNVAHFCSELGKKKHQMNYDIFRNFQTLSSWNYRLSKTFIFFYRYINRTIGHWLFVDIVFFSISVNCCYISDGNFFSQEIHFPISY